MILAKITNSLHDIDDISLEAAANMYRPDDKQFLINLFKVDRKFTEMDGKLREEVVKCYVKFIAWNLIYNNVIIGDVHNWALIGCGVRPDGVSDEMADILTKFAAKLIRYLSDDKEGNNAKVIEFKTSLKTGFPYEENINGDLF